jgi:uncharacterized surface protein with fasciclin (FAS1) repeats
MEQSKNSAMHPLSGSAYAAPSKDLRDTATTAGNFTTFMSAVRMAGLTDVLAGRGPLTVFAPADEAFQKLLPGALDALIRDTRKLKAVLSYHIVKGHFLLQDVQPGEVTTLQGSPLTASVSASGVEVNGVRVKQADMIATNGVVHMIDSVIMPKHWQLLATAA